MKDGHCAAMRSNAVKDLNSRGALIEVKIGILNGRVGRILEALGQSPWSSRRTDVSPSENAC